MYSALWSRVVRFLVLVNGTDHHHYLVVRCENVVRKIFLHYCSREYTTSLMTSAYSPNRALFERAMLLYVLWDVDEVLEYEV